MDKKRILLVCDVYGWGVEVRANKIKEFLSDEFDFDIMDGNQFSKFLIESDKSVIKRKDIISFGKKQGKTIDKDLFYFKDLEDFYLKDKIEDPYDLIFLLLHTQLLRKDVRRILDKRKVITIATCYPVLRASFTVGMEEEQAKERFLNLANKCEAILANNRKTLQDLKSMYNGKTFYACRGIDENVFYETKEFKEKPTNDFTVAYVGKPVDEKGLDNIIIPACKEAGIKLITNTRNYTNALDENKMREFYNQADAYIVASSIDGTPNPALEASACGLTLISNHIGNMPELIIDSKNGFLVKEREIKYYVEILNWMKNNQKESWWIGQKGKFATLKGWTWKNVLNKNERIIFREILK